MNRIYPSEGSIARPQVAIKGRVEGFKSRRKSLLAFFVGDFCIFFFLAGDSGESNPEVGVQRVVVGEERVVPGVERVDRRDPA